jgi:hypothetical protein
MEWRRDPDLLVSLLKNFRATDVEFGWVTVQVSGMKEPPLWDRVKAAFGL